MLENVWGQIFWANQRILGLQSIFVCKHSDYTRFWSVNDVAALSLISTGTPRELCPKGFLEKRPDCISSPKLALLVFIYKVGLDIQLIW